MSHVSSMCHVSSMSHVSSMCHVSSVSHVSSMCHVSSMSHVSVYIGQISFDRPFGKAEAVPKEHVGFATGLVTATRTLMQVTSPVFFAVIFTEWLRYASVVE
jgi:hypothetical protein